MNQSNSTATFLEDLFSLHGRVALVTGGTSGLGLYIAEALCAAGARVFTISRSSPAPNREALGPVQIEHIGHFDVAKREQWELLRAAVASRSERLDILVNNAGDYDTTGFQHTDPDTFDQIFDANLKSVLFVSQSLVPLLRKGAKGPAPARIINIGSVAGRLPVNSPSYSTSKAAVHHITKIMAKELAGEGIRVNAIAPGAFRTPMTAHELDELGDAFVSAFPVGRLGQKSDIQGAIAFLCSKAGEFVTGHVLALDGGFADLRS